MTTRRFYAQPDPDTPMTHATTTVPTTSRMVALLG